jgi:hypothetical protein
LENEIGRIVSSEHLQLPAMFFPQASIIQLNNRKNLYPNTTGDDNNIADFQLLESWSQTINH